MMNKEKSNIDFYALLSWYAECGVDEAISEFPINRLSKEFAENNILSIRNSNETSLSVNEKNFLSTSNNNSPLEESIILSDCNDLESLRKELDAFEGCSLKKTATNLVFSDGDPNASLMVIGEAPGAEEDRAGKPFVGPAGQLLDKMLKSIGLNRADVYITNIVPWRPPGNRPPSQNEIEVCLPFILKQIELVAPNFLLLLGGVSSKSILNSPEGITKIRGKWFNYVYKNNENVTKEILTMPTFHPSYLLRSPIKKRESWEDLLSLKDKLIERSS